MEKFKGENIMQKPNSLMAIRRFNLENKKFLEELFSSLIEIDEDVDGTRPFCIKNSYRFYDNLHLIDLEDPSPYHDFCDYNIDEVAEHFTAEEIHNDRDRYFLFTIEWMDRTCEYELEEGGVDNFFTLDDVKYLKNFNNFHKKITRIEDKQFILERIREEHTDDYYIIGFYANGWKDEWTGEYDSCFDFCGMIDMNKIEVIEENEI